MESDEHYATYCPDCEAMFFEGDEGHDWEQCFDCGESNVYEVSA